MTTKEVLNQLDNLQGHCRDMAEHGIEDPEDSEWAKDVNALEEAKEIVELMQDYDVDFIRELIAKNGPPKSTTHKTTPEERAAFFKHIKDTNPELYEKYLAQYE